jgi:hypothetical protein
MIEPMVAVVAGAEPERQAKNMENSTDTIPRPPITWRTRLLATFIKCDDSPPAVIRSPARIKPGTASRGNFWIPAISVWANTTVSMLTVHSAKTDEMLMANTMGTPRIRRMAKPTVKIQNASLTELTLTPWVE